jgi:hypothetical protein
MREIAVLSGLFCIEEIRFTVPLRQTITIAAIARMISRSSRMLAPLGVGGTSHRAKPDERASHALHEAAGLPWPPVRCT